jgi:hypothetical protein
MKQHVCLALTVLTLTLAFVTACAPNHLPDQDLRIINTPPAYKMPPDDLWKEFQRDPKATQKQYFGKAIDISGKVVAIQPDATKVPVVYFSNPGDKGLRARLLDDRALETIKDAAAGTRITLRCFCEGFTPDQNLLLKSCIRP